MRAEGLLEPLLDEHCLCLFVTDARCAVQVTYMRQQAERHMASLRAASRIRMIQKIGKQDRALHQEQELGMEMPTGQSTLADGDTSKKEYEALHRLATWYARENVALHKLLKEMQALRSSAVLRSVV